MSRIMEEIFILLLLAALFGGGFILYLWWEDRRTHLSQSARPNQQSARQRQLVTQEYYHAHAWQSARPRQPETQGYHPINARQSVESSTQPMMNQNFHMFVKRAVELFQHQRREGYQFAVLFVTSQSDISTAVFYRITQTYFSRLPQEVSIPDIATDKAYPTYPPDHNLCNYIVARPDGKPWEQHAEMLLMNKLDTLLQQYKSSGMPECKTIVLYTWLLPCGRCVKAIVKRLGEQGQHRRVIVIYTTKMKDVTENRACTIVSKMEAAGIIVRQEKYKPRIPHA